MLASGPGSILQILVCVINSLLYNQIANDMIDLAEMYAMVRPDRTARPRTQTWKHDDYTDRSNTWPNYLKEAI